MEYDYLVIGAGSGGMASARRAAEYGAKVAVVENKKLGGTCVNVGCVPKKVMWNAAHVADVLGLAKGYGFNVDDSVVSTHQWSALKQRRDAYVARLNGIYQKNLDNSKVDVLYGTAKFIDNKTVEVNGQHYTAKHILIATGGLPSRPSIEGSEHGIDSDGFFQLENLPKRVAVIGGGYIATELSGVLHGLGAEVSQVVRKDKILPTFDHDIVDIVFQSMKKSGVSMLTGHSPKRLTKNGNQVDLVTEFEGAEQSHEPFDCVLWATGRKPNLSALALETTDVVVNERGYIEVDEYQNTAAEGVYAVGDIIQGGIELTPVAIAAGRHLAERLFNGKARAKMDYDTVASVVFSHPSIGTVGLSEQDARAKFGAEKIVTYQSKFVNMIYAVSDVAPDEKPKTLVKLVTLKKDGWNAQNSAEFEVVVGCHIVGDAADEIIQGFAVAVKMGATKADFDRTVAIHPTAGEELVTLR